VSTVVVVAAGVGWPIDHQLMSTFFSPVKRVTARVLDVGVAPGLPGVHRSSGAASFSGRSLFGNDILRGNENRSTQ
jgi:hypothetical protein